MSYFKALLRLQLIYQVLKRPSERYTLEKLNKKIEEKLQDLGEDIPVTSTRSLQRDLATLRKLGIETTHSRRDGLHILEGPNSEYAESVIDTFDIINVLNADKALNSIVFPERRSCRGTVNTYPLLRAIQKRQDVRFSYQGFRDSESEEYTVHPCALKEVLKRWYLLGIEGESEDISVFGLDRMSDLEILKTEFTPPPLDVAAFYQDCFGIFKDPDKEAEEVILSFNEGDGRYVDSQPIHHSQENISGKDYPGKYVFRLHIQVTCDFILHILSRGHSLEVLKPQWLRERVHEIYCKGAEINAGEAAPIRQ